MFEPSVERRSGCSFSRLEQWAIGSKANSDQLGLAARFEPIRVQSKRWRGLGSVRDAGNKSRERTHQIWLQTVSRLSRNRDRYAAGAVVRVLSVNCFCLTTIHPTPRREKADFIGMNWGELGALPERNRPVNQTFCRSDATSVTQSRVLFTCCRFAGFGYHTRHRPSRTKTARRFRSEATCSRRRDASPRPGRC